MYKILLKILRTRLLSEPLPPPSQEGTGAFLPVWGSLAIRHVDAGSCNACELELQALNGPYYAPERLGVRFVASPRHADLLLVTGPVTCHMEGALVDTHDAMPSPSAVLAVGDCACNGGVFRGSYAVRDGVASVLSVDGEVRGCPPSPSAILSALESIVKPFSDQSQ
ncbi:MAG: NADH-quinone oxidoreductase subunit B family protein [Leptospirales bacterium]